MRPALLALAPLLYPDGAFDIGLHVAAEGIDAALYPDGDEQPLAAVTAPDGHAALAALAACLVGLARDRSDALLRAVGVDPPPPVPARDELAARLAECERELADVTREHSALVDRYGAVVLRLAERDREVAAIASDRDQREAARRVTAEALHGLRDIVCDIANGARVGRGAALDDAQGGIVADALRRIGDELRAARVDPQPPQRAAGLGAGVAADVVDGWCDELHRAGAGVLDVAHAMRRAAAEARQRAGGGEGGGERVERREQGAADVGGVAERVLVAEGVAGAAAAGRRAAGGAR